MTREVCEHNVLINGGCKACKEQANRWRRQAKLLEIDLYESEAACAELMALNDEYRAIIVGLQKTILAEK